MLKMKFKKAIRIAESCGLETVAECYRNIEIHCQNFFACPDIDRELSELANEIEEAAIMFGKTKEEFCQRTIKEVKDAL